MYTIGNPLIAPTMLKHDLGAGLDVPVRLMIYERVSRTILSTFSLLFSCITAQAGPVSLPPVGLPPVNLGDTSFQDGIANPGWLLEEAINYYEASQFKDAQGGTIPGSNELTTISAVTHLAYISKLRVLEGYLG
jgi:hypothetical protein